MPGTARAKRGKSRGSAGFLPPIPCRLDQRANRTERAVTECVGGVIEASASREGVFGVTRTHLTVPLVLFGDRVQRSPRGTRDVGVGGTVPEAVQALTTVVPLRDGDLSSLGTVGLGVESANDLIELRRGDGLRVQSSRLLLELRVVGGGDVERLTRSHDLALHALRVANLERRLSALHGDVESVRALGANRTHEHVNRARSVVGRGDREVGLDHVSGPVGVDHDVIEDSESAEHDSVVLDRTSDLPASTAVEDVVSERERVAVLDDRVTATHDAKDGLTTIGVGANGCEGPGVQRLLVVRDEGDQRDLEIQTSAVDHVVGGDGLVLTEDGTDAVIRGNAARGEGRNLSGTAHVELLSW